MTRTELNQITKRAESDGWNIRGTRNYGKGDYSLDVIDPKTGYGKTFHSVEAYDEWKREQDFYAETANA